MTPHHYRKRNERESGDSPNQKVGADAFGRNVTPRPNCNAQFQDEGDCSNPLEFRKHRIQVMLNPDKDRCLVPHGQVNASQQREGNNGVRKRRNSKEFLVAEQPKPEAAVAAQPKAVPAASALASAPADIKQQERKKGSADKLTQQKPAKRSTPSQVTAPTPPPQDDVPRPPMPIGPSDGSRR